MIRSKKLEELAETARGNYPNHPALNPVFQNLENLQDSMSPEVFKDILITVNNGFEIAKFGGRYEKSLDDINELLKFSVENTDFYKKPETKRMLKSINKAIGNSVFEVFFEEDDFFGSYAPNLIISAPPVAGYLLTKLPESIIESVYHLVEMPGFISPLCLSKCLLDLPEIADKSEEFNYLSEFTKMLGIIGKMSSGGYHAFLLVDEFLELCDELGHRHSLYGEIADRIGHAVEINPYNAELLNKKSLLPTLRKYREAGLGDRYLEILDYCMALLEGEDSKFRPVKDLPVEIFENFPDIYKKYGEGSFELISWIYKRLGNAWRLEEVMKGVNKFFSEGWGKRIEFDRWLKYLGTVTKKIYDKNLAVDLIEDSFDVIENGVDLDVYFNYTGQLFYNALFKSKVLKPFFTAYIDEGAKRRFFGYYDSLCKIEGIPQFEPNEDWLRSVGEFLSMPYDDLVCWLDQMNEDKNRIISDEEFLRVPPSVDCFKRDELIVYYLGLERYFLALPEFVKNRINLAEAYKLRANLPDKPELAVKLKNVINCNADIEEKQRFVRYFNVLSNIPKVREPYCSEEWLDESAARLNIPQDRFREWIEKVQYDRSNVPHDRVIRKCYCDALPVLFKEGVDIVEAFNLRSHLSFFCPNADYAVKLKNIINADKTLNEKIEVIDKLRDYSHLVDILPPTHFDFERWKEEAEKAAEGYFQCNGIDIVYSADFSTALLKATHKKDSRQILLELARIEQQGISTKPRFNLGRIYADEAVYGLKVKDDPAITTRLLIAGLLSRSDETIRESCSYFDDAKLSSAREFIHRSHFSPGMLYRMIRHDFERLQHAKGDEQIAAGRSLIKTLRDAYLSSDRDAQGKTELRELVWLVESVYEGEEIFDSIVARMQTGSLSDLRDGKRLLCCAMVSEDSEKTEIESLYYCIDSSIGILHVVPRMQGQYGLPIGAAILVNTYDSYGRNVLLVDSVEGGARFQQIDESKSFPLVTKGIYGTALDSDSSLVMFNCRVPNRTPKRYNEFVGKRFAQREVVYGLTKIPDRNPFVKRSKRLLEAFDDMEVLSGLVTGYMVKRNELADMVK